MLSDDLEGWDGRRGGKLRREEMYNYNVCIVWLICIVVGQKSAQHYKIFKYKNIFKNEYALNI